MASGGQLVEQRSSFFQIARVKPFGEPTVDRSEKLASFIPLPVIAPEPRHAHRRLAIRFSSLWLLILLTALAFFSEAYAGSDERAKVDQLVFAPVINFMATMSTNSEAVGVWCSTQQGRRFCLN